MYTIHTYIYIYIHMYTCVQHRRRSERWTPSRLGGLRLIQEVDSFEMSLTPSRGDSFETGTSYNTICGLLREGEPGRLPAPIKRKQRF